MIDIQYIAEQYRLRLASLSAAKQHPLATSTKTIAIPKCEPGSRDQVFSPYAISQLQSGDATASGKQYLSD
jgi:hypothetical protein